ncbi:alpha/beta hydrolase-fold protein [Winogradskyella vidalii]|uniref:alpha/beta hydrolase-fold protein n=1 Tax=Winogradskyella vidalii TaxID=2615024 RepID=UPI0015C951AC|nr:alpha/beta hydrolase-fold protein [Winogradskyella vidalii]
MRKTILLVLACITYVSSFSQVTYKEISSSRLSSERKLKIKLPKDYDSNGEEKYPVIVVFDGDYLFEPVAGQVDFQTYFDNMPSSIVVGVMQGENRFYDAYFDPVTGLPTESGLRFHDFVSEELLPYIDDNYKTSRFRIAVAHDQMGNFINSYLFKKELDFQAYVCISPDFTGSLNNFISKRLSLFKDDIFYYMATSEKDIPQVRQHILTTDAQLKDVDNHNVTYYFDDFENETHYTLVTAAISSSFEKIFDIYNPLREKELEEKVLPYEGTLDRYLTDRYDRIEKLFGIKKEISEDEIEKVAQIAEQREDLKSLTKLGDLANKLHPESLLGTYYLAQSAEGFGKTKKAKKLYESALTLNDVSHINREYIFSKIDELTVVDLDEEIEDEDDGEE